MSSLSCKEGKLYKGILIGVLKERLSSEENLKLEVLLSDVFSSPMNYIEQKDIVFRLGKESIFGEGINCCYN